ncbi:hypothetical protein [Parasedimentitalea psychrophila]|uniref:Uncharacterized protein n=1 Tax=Parasedimentitalea psychrophila TaxID=2997337 RepID=A0A9Y2P3Q5_9RHOB|nr:hypothetical protein [Parasedimentitalea psychrophila]WIY24524.1 hypothetical protein QPJ95_18575 [Parasedimentitalea psychrophila]
MVEETAISIEYFQQLRNRQNVLYRVNTAEIRATAKKKDMATLNALRADRAKMAQNDQLIFKAELAFQATQLGQSEAEKRLRQHVREINKFVKTVKTVAKVLESTAKVASILARLIKVLT